MLNHLHQLSISRYSYLMLGCRQWERIRPPIWQFQPSEICTGPLLSPTHKWDARHTQLLIDICCRRQCSAANPPAAFVAVNWQDWPMDGLTDARPLHRPCSAYYAGSVNNGCLVLIFCSLLSLAARQHLYRCVIVMYSIYDLRMVLIFALVWFGDIWVCMMVMPWHQIQMLILGMQYFHFQLSTAICLAVWI